MLNHSPSPAHSITEALERLLGQPLSSASSTLSQSVDLIAEASMADALDDDTVVEWSEEDIVFLHWRLLRQLSGLSDPETPLEEKLNVLRWVFSEHDKESRPFSFANCLRVVGCSPLSPAPHLDRWSGPVRRLRLVSREDMAPRHGRAVSLLGA